jgi:hypothetical protein
LRMVKNNPHSIPLKPFGPPRSGYPGMSSSSNVSVYEAIAIGCDFGLDILARHISWPARKP